MIASLEGKGMRINHFLQERPMDRPKKPYEKPAVVYREKIEAKAGSCAKAGAGTCKTGPYVS